MTLRLKIHLIVAALTLAFVGTVFGLQFRSAKASVHEEVVAANRVAEQLLRRTVWRYAAQGVPAMQAFLASLGRVRSSEIMLYDEAGDELYHSPPSAYKPGRAAPDWFADLITPDSPDQSIEFPGGRLVVRSDASRAAIDAWDEFIGLAVGSLALLLLANALVFALVGHAVRPFGRIVDALRTLESGRFDVQLPPLPGREAATIGAAFNRMVGVLRDHIETERRAVMAERQLSDRRELSRWIDHHIEQERRAIARELHDEFGQSVTAIRSMALSVAQRVQALDPQSEQAARLIAEESSRLYDAMHGLIPRLAPLVLDSFGLDDALNDLVQRTRKSQPGVQIELHTALAGVPLEADTALALYRAAQEGLTNALRHGGAQHVQLTLAGTLEADPAPTRAAGADERREGLALSVRDDGCGLPATPASDDGRAAGPEGGHYGLRWLAERVESLGGCYTLRNEPPRGARLWVWLPTVAAPTPGGDPALGPREPQEERTA